MGEEFSISVGEDIGTQSVMKIHIDTKVISGQIKSLYVIQKRNNEYNFILLNNGEVQDKFSGVKKYKTNLLIDMEQKTDYDSNNIGIGQLYILSEDLNGKIEIDVIQIIGSINWIRNDELNYTINVDFNNPEYTFRYLKNNYLVTLNNNNEGWVNLSNKYLDIVEKADVKRIEEDISMAVFCGKECA